MINKVLAYLNKGQARSISAKKNILGMLFLKVISIVLSLVIIPVTIGYVSSYQYGIWLTISSLVGWFSFFDIGLGNGLKNKFIEAISLNKKKLAKIYVSTTYAILGLIILIAWLIGIVLNSFLNWGSILNVPLEMNKELNIVVFIVLTNFCLQFVLKLITTLLNAVQKPAIASLFDTLIQLLVLVLVVVVAKITEGSLINLAIILGISSLFVLLAGSVWAFSGFLSFCRPNIRYVKFRFAKDLTALGFKFFFLQIIAIIIYQTNNIIITRLLGPEEVTVYNVAFKYMNIITMLFTIVLTPFWSAFVEASTLSDFEWMKRMTRKLRLTLFLIGIGGGVLVAISPLFYKIWLRGELYIPFIVTLLMFFYHIFNMWGTLHTQLLAGLGKIKLQLIFSMICGILNIPLSLLFCQYWGLPGLICANILVFLLFNSWFGFIQVNKLLNQTAKGIWNE